MIEIKQRFDEILRKSHFEYPRYSILSAADEIKNLRDQLEEAEETTQLEYYSGLVKNAVQREAEHALSINYNWGAFIGATGVGKSKVGIDKVFQTCYYPNSVKIEDKGKERDPYEYNVIVSDENAKARVLLIVPTERLRDHGWKEEFDKWHMSRLWSNVEATCYASLHTYEDTEWDLVIMDELHNITEANSMFFFKNKVHRLVGLTATPPTDLIKKELLTQIGLFPVYTVTLDEAVKLGLVAPYEITVVTMKLDGVDKYIKAGSKDKPFMQTELGQYNFLTKSATFGSNKMSRINRMQFIRNLRSKTRAAKQILEQIIPEDVRTLIFAGSKKQAVEVCDRRYFSKPTPPKLPKKFTASSTEAMFDSKMREYFKMLDYYEGNKALNDLIAGTINRMVCVEALNEGQNLPLLDCGFIIQVNSQELDLIQRIGRLIRWRLGHIGRIIILCVEGSVDEEWVRKCTKKLSQANIKWIKLEELLSGKETISF